MRFLAIFLVVWHGIPLELFAVRQKSTQQFPLT